MFGTLQIMLPTHAQAELAAPDAKSLTAARKLVRPGVWSHLGWDEAALWGSCAGSRVYNVRCDLADLTTSCNCPSRKFPCKHGLALLFVAADGMVPQGKQPIWVAEWLAKRRERSEKKAERAAKAAEPVDAATADKRAKASARTSSKRADAIASGLAQLELWMQDQVRYGLAAWESQSDEWFEARARALHDAKAPGLARRVANLALLLDGSPTWPARALGELGLLMLQTDAWSRLDELPAPLQADLRSSIGLRPNKSAIATDGERISDRWRVLAATRRQLDELTESRTWLRGLTTGRYALLLDYGYRGAALAPPRRVTSQLDASLAYYPSAYPQRALLLDDDVTVDTGDADDETGGHARVDGFLASAAAAFAAVPWTRTVPCELRHVRLARDESWWLCDQDDRALELLGTPWDLLAISGGHPVRVFGEWNGDRLKVMHCAAER